MSFTQRSKGQPNDNTQPISKLGYICGPVYNLTLPYLPAKAAKLPQASSATDVVNQNTPALDTGSFCQRL